MPQPESVSIKIQITAGAVEAYLRRNVPLSLVSGLGGALAILLLAQLSRSLVLTMLIAPFGASCVLLFAVPQSPLAQPRNVVCGHLLSASIGLVAMGLFGHGVAACSISVGCAIAAMQFTETLHPPAGADPLVVILVHAGWIFLAAPIFAGTVMLVATAWLYHRFVSKRPYPS